MNDPKPRIEPDTDIGPLDDQGQQIWTSAEAAAIERLHRDPAYWAGVAEAESDISAGRVHSQEEVLAASAERRRRYLAQRKR